VPDCTEESSPRVNFVLCCCNFRSRAPSLLSREPPTGAVSDLFRRGSACLRLEIRSQVWEEWFRRSRSEEVRVSDFRGVEAGELGGDRETSSGSSDKLRSEDSLFRSGKVLLERRSRSIRFKRREGVCDSVFRGVEAGELGVDRETSSRSSDTLRSEDSLFRSGKVLLERRSLV
jgi:hypothetical protein